MFSERMQILLSPAQRRRVEAEARRRGVSVAAVIREAIDARVDAVSPDRRLAALERLRSRRVPFVAPERLRELIDDRGDDVASPAG